MKLRITALICLLASTTAVFAGPQSAETAGNLQLLRGTYAMTSHQASYVTWYAQVSCKNYSGTLYADSDVANRSTDGTLTFDGKGGVTYSVKSYGKFDQNSSNLTPTWACDSNGNPFIVTGGHAVYYPPQPSNGAASYYLQSDYTGWIDLGGGDQLNLRLSGVNWIGLATSFTFHSSNKTDNSNKIGEVGTAIMQMCGRWCMP